MLMYYKVPYFIVTGCLSFDDGVDEQLDYN